jgi:hypothetical protein
MAYQVERDHFNVCLPELVLGEVLPDRLPGGHDVRLAAPFDLVEPTLHVAGVEVADLDMAVGEPVRHQPAAFVTAVGLRLSGFRGHVPDHRVRVAAHGVQLGVGVWGGLKVLPWHPSYLAAMWVLGGELRSLYADWIGADEVSLLETTMDLVREVIIAGESWSAIDRAEELADAWGPVLARHEASFAPGGLLNALATFEALAQEIARLSGHYDAGNWATNARVVSTVTTMTGPDWDPVRIRAQIFGQP